MSNWAGAVMQFFTFFTTQLRIIVLAAKTMQSSNKQAEYPKIFSGKFKLSNRVWKSSKTSSIWVFISFLWKRASKKFPKPWGSSCCNLWAVNVFDFQVLVKDFLDFTSYSRALLGTYALSSTIFPFGSSLVTKVEIPGTQKLEKLSVSVRYL